MRLYVDTKFCAAHCLGSDKFSDEQNDAIYGECGRVHGHTWRVEVVVDGPVDMRTGMVVNFKDIKRNINDRFDHRFLNEVLAISNPTAEILASEILTRIKRLGAFDYVMVRVWESDTCYAEESWDKE